MYLMTSNKHIFLGVDMAIEMLRRFDIILLVSFQNNRFIQEVKRYLLTPLKTRTLFLSK
jgi:hypothetical protein